ncbi:MAG TPA: hypothetical protein EYN96_00235 [Candidatus Hydrogenedentes bacterium]|nr:hypothetical protein [Candidatus Hydrogenedentota bacterium]
MSFTTLILAAGKSQRMGYAKAWLRFEGQSFLERILHAAQQSSTTSISIVVGTDDNSPWVTRRDVEAILPDSPLCPISIVVGEPEKAPIDSIRRGISDLPPNRRMLLWPVDYPFATAELIHKLELSFDDEADHIARPLVNNHHGHPVLFGRRGVHELLEHGADSGAHEVVHLNAERLIDIPWDDERLAVSINTPEEAKRFGVEIPHSVD